MLFTAVDGGYVLAGISDKGRALLDGAGFADGFFGRLAVDDCFLGVARGACDPRLPREGRPLCFTTRSA